MPKGKRKAMQNCVDEKTPSLSANEISSNDGDVDFDEVDIEKKRGASGDDGDFSSEMKKMLECFGTDVSKTLAAKRRRLEQFTKNSTENTNKRMEEVWQAQQTERSKLCEEYTRQTQAVFTQWDSDLTKTKEQEDKLMHMFQQQQKLFQQARVIQSQRLKTLRQLHEQFTKGMQDLHQFHSKQQTSVHSEMKKEMAMLQKKILMDTQQQEMANVRKSLQTMLF